MTWNGEEIRPASEVRGIRALRKQDTRAIGDSTWQWDEADWSDEEEEGNLAVVPNEEPNHLLQGEAANQDRLLGKSDRDEVEGVEKWDWTRTEGTKRKWVREPSQWEGGSGHGDICDEM